MTWKQKITPFSSLIDQGWLSFLNFFIALSFIWWSTKEEYAYYLLLIPIILFAQSIQNALINSPLMSVYPRSSPQEQVELEESSHKLQTQLTIIITLITGIGLSTYLWTHEQKEIIAPLTGFVLAIFGTMLREAKRNLAYTKRSPLTALSADLIYGSFLLIGIIILLNGDTITATMMLMVTGIAGIASSLPLQRKRSPASSTSVKSHRKLWKYGRWALPSVVATWATLSAYPFFTAKYLGLSAVADIGAARMLLMPLGLATTAWMNWYRPKISNWLGNRQQNKTKKISRKSLKILFISAIILAIAIHMAYPIIESILGESYENIEPLMIGWLIYFTLSFARNIYLATIIVIENGYRIMHHTTWAALLISLAMFMSLSTNGTLWIIGILCVAEVINLIVARHFAHKNWKQTDIKISEGTKG